MTSDELKQRGRALWGRARDPVRLGIQAAVAAAATYAVMTVLAWPHATWALISVLFVLQLNSDATRRSLTDRLAGTAVGSLIGLAAVVVLPGEAQAAWRVPLASFAAMAFAVTHPSRSYVMVAAIAVALESSDPAWAGALERIRAIAMGSFMAMAASSLIWREPASTRALRGLARALDRCRDLASEVICSAGNGQEGGADRRHLHADVHRAMRRAQGQVADCRDGSRAALGRVERRIERIWHDLVFIDRASAGEAASPELTAMGDAICHRLDGARERVLNRGKLRDEARGGSGQPETALPAIDYNEPLTFAVHELQRDLACLDEEITDLVTGPSRKAAAA